MSEEHIYMGLSEPLKPPEKIAINLTETELTLGLPGSDRKPAKNFVSGAKRGFADASGKWALGIHAGSEGNFVQTDTEIVPALPEKNQNQNPNNAPASKAQVVGWPPIRSFRKNTLATNLPKDNNARKSEPACLYVKVSMDGAPYLRKIDLKTYTAYAQLSKALEKMFTCFTIGQCGQGLAGQENLTESRLMDLLHGSEYVLTYEDKDGDWMLVGDVPWEMFMDSCKRLRIMKGSDAIGLAPRTMQKCQSQN